MKPKLEEYAEAQTHKIETDIPIPTYTGYWNELAMRMKPGDSVLVKDDKEAKILKQAIRLVWSHIKTSEDTFEAWKRRTKSMKANAEGEYRVWRVI
nr:hypothetical protein [uncultured Mediterranean phage uvMED]|tara:strand:+ start:116 stop:403 length:288 start_codon:yes stop_codon:yes gene_type:complete